MVTARCTPTVFAVKPVLSFQLSPAPEPTTTHAQKKNMHKKRTPLHAECHDRCVLRWTKMHYFSPRYIQCSPWCVMFSLVHSCCLWDVHVLPGVFMFSLVHSCSPWDIHVLPGMFMLSLVRSCGPQTQRDTGPSPMLPYCFQSLSPILKHCNGSVFSFTQRRNDWGKLVWSAV